MNERKFIEMQIHERRDPRVRRSNLGVDSLKNKVQKLQRHPNARMKEEVGKILFHFCAS